MLMKFFNSKWTSLFCALINSTFASISWDNGDVIVASLCFVLSFYCGFNFLVGIKEDYYDQSGK